jgi:hypothetical protein
MERREEAAGGVGAEMCDRPADAPVPSVRGVPEMRSIMRRTNLLLSVIKTFTGEKTLMNAVALVLHGQ